MDFVLIHGGAHAGSCWERLVPHLDAPAHALDLPGRGRRPAPLDGLGVADWVDAVVAETLALASGPVVLVGHSLAGITLPRVAERIPERIAHLVFVSCTVPPGGQCVLDVIAAEVVALTPAAARGDALLSEAVARAMFCNDMDEEETRFVLERLVPEARRPMQEPMDLTGLRRPIPRSYVKLLRDQSVPPRDQDRMIATIGGGCRVVELDAGHDAMVSQPRALAEILNRIRRDQLSSSTSKRAV